MTGNTFGKLFQVTTFGESHGPALGVVIDGMPPRILINKDKLKQCLKKRSPGNVAWTTSRKEPDDPIIISGIFENKTLGTPITVIVYNKDARSRDYRSWKKEYRPGHGDRTFDLKYGIRDFRGGGRASGRETLSRVIAGYFAQLLLPKKLTIKAFIKKIGPFVSTMSSPKILKNPLNSFPKKQQEEIKIFLNDLKSQGDSVGGEVNVVISGCPAGLGCPVFDKIKSDLAKAITSIGACVGFTYGDFESFQKEYGSKITKDLSAFGGIEGGITNGENIFFQATFRPPSTVGKKAKEGRHDPCILPRVLPVVESMVAIVLADHYLRQKVNHLHS